MEQLIVSQGNMAKHEDQESFKTVTTRDGKSSFNYTKLYDPAIVAACQEWYGVVNLETLYDAIDRWNQGARPINVNTIKFNHKSTDAMNIIQIYNEYEGQN